MGADGIGRAASALAIAAWSAIACVDASPAASRPVPPSPDATTPSATTPSAATPSATASAGAGDPGEAISAAPPAPSSAAPSGPPRDAGAAPSSTAPRLVFRDLHTGMLPGRATRRSWTLIREGALWVLAVRVEQGPNGRLDGSERAGAQWAPSSEATYRGEARGGASVELVRIGGEVAALPARLEVSCKPSKVATVAPSAVLLGGDACGNGGPKPRWKPAQRKEVAVELCSIGASASSFDADLAFASAPGVEWAFENSDCVVQEGAYRRLE